MSKTNGNSENGNRATYHIARSIKDNKPYAVRIAAGGRINLARGPLNLELKPKAKKIKLSQDASAKSFAENDKIPIVSTKSQIFKIGFELLE